mgnify:FL=1|jgi:hypothetical protein
MNIDVRTARAMTPLLEEALEHLKKASELIHDTGDIEDDELDNVSSFVAGSIKKLDFYLGKL